MSKNKQNNKKYTTTMEAGLAEGLAYQPNI